jgi:hypothetical protein
VSAMTRRSRQRAWIFEIVVYVLLMLLFGALVEPPRGDLAFSEVAARIVLFGGIAVTFVGFVFRWRTFKRRARRARPAALSALSALDLASPVSRRAFTEQARKYAAAHLDTVGDRIWRLVEALRWSSPARRDFSSLEPLLADARRCVSIERRAMEYLASTLEHPPVRTLDALTRGERWILIAGIPVASSCLYVFSLTPGSNLIVRLLLFDVGLLAVPLLLGSWFRSRRERVTATLCSALRSEGFESDPLAVDVFLDVLADRAKKMS